MGGDSEGTNPKRYKITFLVIAIVAASVAVTYYPEPKPLIPTPLPDNRIIIRMTIISENLDKFRQIYPATGTIVSFTKSLMMDNLRIRVLRPEQILMA